MKILNNNVEFNLILGKVKTATTTAPVIKTNAPFIKTNAPTTKKARTTTTTTSTTVEPTVDPHEEKLQNSIDNCIDVYETRKCQQLMNAGMSCEKDHLEMFCERSCGFCGKKSFLHFSSK